MPTKNNISESKNKQNKEIMFIIQKYIDMNMFRVSIQP